MTWRVIARKDYAESRDSRLVRYLLYLLVAVLLFRGYLFPVLTTGEVTLERSAGFAFFAVELLVPLLAILLGYNAIVGERESGRLALLLSLPHTRRDVVVGKLVGRGAVLVVGVVAGLVGAGALVVYPFGELSGSSALAYAAYVLLTLGFAAVFFGIGLAISTFTASKRLATMAGFGVFFVFVIVWDSLRDGLSFALERAGLVDGGLPDPLLFVHGLEPTTLYERIVAGFFESSSTGPYLGPDASWYLGAEVALVAFLVWMVVPLAVGYRRFEVTDL